MNDIFLVVRALKEVVSEPHWYDVDCVDEGYRAALRLEQLKPVMVLSTGTKLYALDEEKNGG